jgi:hypothetical protein
MKNHKLLTLVVLALGLVACGTTTPPMQEPEPVAQTDQAEAQLLIGKNCSLMPCDWKALGPALNTSNSSRALFPDMVLDATGTPIVSFVDGSPSNFMGSLYVKRWNGSSWVLLGGAIDSINTTWPIAPILRIDRAGFPAVAYWLQRTASRSPSIVRRWNGSSWASLGEVPCTLDGFGDLAFDQNNQAVFVCNNYDAGSQSGSLEFFRHNGVGWVSAITSIPFATQPKLAVDASNRLVVGFKQTVAGSPLKAMRSSGNFWDDLGNVGLNNVHTFDFKLEPGGSPVFAALTPANSPSQITVRRGANGVYAAVGSAIPTTTRYSTVSLAINPSNQMGVSFADTNGLVRMQRFNAASNTWGAMGDSINAMINALAYPMPKLVLRANGNPVVAWQEYQFSQSRWVNVKEWGVVPPVVIGQK